MNTNTIQNEVVFITGGAGFIGTALTRRLIEKNRVIIYDSFARNALQYFPELNNHPNLTVIKGDIRDLAKLSSSIGDSTFVFHLAAIAGVSKYFSMPANVMEVNVIGTYNLLETIKNNKKIKAFVDFSTSESYGSNCFNANEEGDVKMENLSEKRWTYATSKIVSEKFGMSHFWQYQTPFIGIRPFNIYGPGQVGEGVVSYFLNTAYKLGTLKITGDGSQCRTFCYIDDFIDGLLLLVQNTEKTIGHSYNIGTNLEMVSVYTLAMMVQDIIGKEIKLDFVQHQGADVMVRSPSIEKISKLGYSPKIKLKDGLRQTLQWYSDNNIMLD